MLKKVYSNLTCFEINNIIVNDTNYGNDKKIYQVVENVYFGLYRNEILVINTKRVISRHLKDEQCNGQNNGCKDKQ